MSGILFTDRELDVMNVLWEQGSATVAEAQGAIADDLAYTTVLTVLQTLEEKGHVRHEREGRAYRYFPTVERREAAGSALRRLIRQLFQGDPELLLTHMVSGRELSDEEIRRLRRLLNVRLRNRRERGAHETGEPPGQEPGPQEDEP